MNSVLTAVFFHRADRAAAPGRRNALWRVLSTWDERIRARRELARLAKEAPQLIENAGLTMAEVDAELAKPFWRR